MRSRLLDDSTETTYAVVLETGDEVVAELRALAAENGLAAARVTAIGAFSSATLGYFDWERKEYLPIEVPEQVEVVSALGDIALGPHGEPALHLHAVVGRPDGSVMGGHLLAGYVRPTLEALVVESPRHLQRRHDDETGLALIDLR